MKVLFTATYFYPYLSGLTDYPLKVASYLAQKHQVSVLTFQHSNTLPTQENFNNILINRLPVHFRISKGLINLFYPLFALTKIFSTDVVFINLPQFEGIFPAFFGRLLGKKTYVIYHCELSFNQGPVFKFIEWLTNLSAFFSCLFANKVIAYTKDYATHSSVLKHFLSKVVYMLPPVEVAEPDKSFQHLLVNHYGKKHTPIIGFSGRVSSEKGLEVLLEALSLLRAKHPHAMLWCAGPYGADVVGEQEYFAKIQKIVATKKLPVAFLGKLTKEQLASFYKSIDILVLPSLNKTESFGMVQAEAMLSGTPVVASNLPGVRMPVLLTDMGAIAQPGNVQDLSTKIATVLRSHLKMLFQKHPVASTIFDCNKTYQFYETLIHE